MERPYCCPEPRCTPVHQLDGYEGDEHDLSKPQPGESFFCFGRMAEPVEFTYDGAQHRNDLRSCGYTPLKGIISWQENLDDWRALSNAYGRAARVIEANP